jgi:hypothetical protein
MSTVMRWREAVCEAQKANAHAMWLQTLMQRADLHDDPIVHTISLTLDTKAIMDTNKALDQCNGILVAILKHNGCLA